MSPTTSEVQHNQYRAVSDKIYCTIFGSNLFLKISGGKHRSSDKESFHCQSSPSEVEQQQAEQFPIISAHQQQLVLTDQ